jgi:hypothetical protein
LRITSYFTPGSWEAGTVQPIVTDEAEASVAVAFVGADRLLA